MTLPTIGARSIETAPALPAASLSFPNPGNELLAELDQLEPLLPTVADAARRRDVPPRTLKSTAEVETLVDQIIARSYPRLAERQVSVATFRAENFYFRAKPKVGSVLNPFAKARFTVEVNTRAFERGLPYAAAEAIIAHELAHVEHYVEHGVGGMLSTGWAQVNSHAGRCVERATDMVAIVAGYGEGLVAYRKWIYPQLDPKGLAAKRQTYFTPDEINEIEVGRTRFPQLNAYWVAHPPQSLLEIRTDLATLEAGKKLR